MATSSYVGAENLSWDNVTLGINKTEMENYKEALKLEVLTQTVDKIREVDALEKKVTEYWQGKSRDNFLKQFYTMREKICDDLEKEYKDIEHRINELQSMYAKQDNTMLPE